MASIYFTSDTHYGHQNIASKNNSQWKEGQRHYYSLEEMNQDIIKQFNKTLKSDDILYHLGDWSFGGIGNIYDFWKQLPTKNIHLILGNHDTHIDANKILPNCIDTGTLTQRIIIDGKPDSPTDFVFAKDLFLSVNQVNNISEFFMSHYAHRVWPGSHKGAIHLYGHSHDSLDKPEFTGIPFVKEPAWGKSMDVGIDSAIRILGVARPFHIEEIREIMKSREIFFPDHHNSKTNV